MKEVIHVKIRDYVEVFARREKVAVVVFGVESCTCIKELEEVLPKIADNVTELDVRCYFVVIPDDNIKEIEAVKKNFKVANYPAIIFYKDGKCEKHEISQVDKTNLEKIFREVLS